MKIRPQERQWFTPSLTAHKADGTPILVPVNGWEASVNKGVTWLPSRNSGGNIPGWLIAGSAFPGPGDSANGVAADFTLTSTVRMHIRLRDMPETTIADPILIELLT